MRIGVLFAALLFLGSIQAQSTCPIIKLLGGQGSPDAIKRTSTKLCTAVDSSCCTDDDWSLLEQNFQGAKTRGNEESLFNRYQRRLNQAVITLNKILKVQESIKTNANEMLAVKDVSSPCKAASETIKASTRITATYSQTYKAHVEKCLPALSLFVDSLYCSACDFKSKDRFDAATKTMTWSNKSCKAYADECLPLISENLSYIYPFIDAVETLSRCTKTGMLNAAMNQYKFIEFISNSASTEVSNCSKNPLEGNTDCVNVCKKALSLSTEGSYEILNSSYILAVYKRYADRYSLTTALTADETTDYKAYDTGVSDRAFGKTPVPPAGELWYQVQQGIRLNFAVQGQETYLNSTLVLKGLSSKAIYTDTGARVLGLVSGLIGLLMLFAVVY
jgi:hypothetical protein